MGTWLCVPLLSIKSKTFTLCVHFYIYTDKLTYMYTSIELNDCIKNNNWEQLINGLTSNYYSMDLQRSFAKVSWWTYNTIFVWRQRVKYIRNCSSLYRGIRYPLYLFCIEICNVSLIVFLVLVKKLENELLKIVNTGQIYMYYACLCTKHIKAPI